MITLRNLTVAVLLVVAPLSAGAAERRTPNNSIEVTGDARVEAPANLALLDFGVTTQADTAAAAARLNSERMEAVLAAVRRTLGAEARISTGAYSVRPVYAVQPRESGPPRVTGYEASNVAHLKTTALARVGETIDAAVSAGANQVQRLAFTLSDDRAQRREALRAAVLEAREKAQAIAAALGANAGAVRWVVEQDVGVVQPLVRQAMAMRAESAPLTPVEPGLVEVRARVVLNVEIAR